MSDAKTENGHRTAGTTVADLTTAVSKHLSPLTQEQRGIAKFLLNLPEADRMAILGAVTQLKDTWSAATTEQLQRVLVSLNQEMPISRFGTVFGGKR